MPMCVAMVTGGVAGATTGGAGKEREAVTRSLASVKQIMNEEPVMSSPAVPSPLRTACSVRCHTEPCSPLAFPSPLPPPSPSQVCCLPVLQAVLVWHRGPCPAGPVCGRGTGGLPAVRHAPGDGLTARGGGQAARAGLIRSSNSAGPPEQDLQWPSAVAVGLAQTGRRCVALQVGGGALSLPGLTHWPLFSEDCHSWGEQYRTQQHPSGAGSHRGHA